MGSRSGRTNEPVPAPELHEWMDEPPPASTIVRPRGHQPHPVVSKFPIRTRPVAWGVISAARRESQQVLNSCPRRIGTLQERWLDFLAPHRRVAAEILRGKLWPTHPHHWVPLVFNLSRLVHDMLDTARIPGEGTLRAFQEVGLTFVLLATLGDWARDRSKAQAWTKRRLRRRLARAGRAAACLARNRYAESPRPPFARRDAAGRNAGSGFTSRAG